MDNWNNFCWNNEFTFLIQNASCYLLLIFRSFMADLKSHLYRTEFVCEQKIIYLTVSSTSNVFSLKKFQGSKRNENQVLQCYWIYCPFLYAYICVCVCGGEWGHKRHVKFQMLKLLVFSPWIYCNFCSFSNTMCLKIFELIFRYIKISSK